MTRQQRHTRTRQDSTTQTKRTMAHLLMPLSFLLLAYGLGWLALRPLWDYAGNTLGMFITQTAPDFEGNLTSIYTGNTLTGGTINLADVVIPDIGTHYAQLSCLRLGMDIPVYYGDMDNILARGAGHFAGSALPGFGSTTLLAGHNNTWFRPLEYVTTGDLFTYTTNYGTYVYKVRDIKILRYDDPTAVNLTQQEKEELILYTCYDFTTLSGRKQQRLFVYCDRISGPEIR